MITGRSPGAPAEVWNQISEYLVGRGFRRQGFSAVRTVGDLQHVIVFDHVRRRPPDVDTFTLHLTARSRDVSTVLDAWECAAGDRVSEGSTIFSENIGYVSGDCYKQWELGDDAEAAGLASEAIAMLEDSIDALAFRYGSVASVASVVLEDRSPVVDSLTRAAVLVVAGRLEDALQLLMAARNRERTLPRHVFPKNLRTIEAAIIDVQSRQHGHAS